MNAGRDSSSARRALTPALAPSGSGCIQIAPSPANSKPRAGIEPATIRSQGLSPECRCRGGLAPHLERSEFAGARSSDGHAAGGVVVAYLEVDRCEHAERGVAALTVVDTRNSKITFARSIRVFHGLRSSTSTCIRDQNDSMAASSQQSPIEPIDVTEPGSSARRVSAREVIRTPWSVCIRVARGAGHREPNAIPRASVTSSADWQASMGRPTTRHDHPATRLPMLRHAEVPPALVARTSSV